jgi:hypothetical protein
MKGFRHIRFNQSDDQSVMAVGLVVLYDSETPAAVVLAKILSAEAGL